MIHNLKLCSKFVTNLKSYDLRVICMVQQD